MTSLRSITLLSLALFGLAVTAPSQGGCNQYYCQPNNECGEPWVCMGPGQVCDNCRLTQETVICTEIQFVMVCISPPCNCPK